MSDARPRRRGWWIALAGLVLVFVALGLARLFARPLGERAFERAVDRGLSRDLFAELGDGLHVLLCGTGSPLPDPRRAGPCTIVVAGGRALMVDAGSGSVRVAMRMGVPLADLGAIYLTHLHSDHIDGLGEATLQAWIAGTRATPLPVHGPPGTAQVVHGFNDAYRLDSGYRVAHHGAAVVPPSGFGATPLEFEAPVEGDPLVVTETGGLRVTVFSVRHAPVSPAVGYRFDYRGRSVVISGDTAFSEHLVEVASGADVILHEALQPRLVAAMRAAAERRGRANLAAITGDIPDYHASPEDAARAARAAGAKTLILHHVVPPLPTRWLYPAFLGDAEREFPGELVVGEDGLAVSLPPDSDAVLRRSLL